MTWVPGRPRVQRTEREDMREARPLFLSIARLSSPPP